MRQTLELQARSRQRDIHLVVIECGGVFIALVHRDAVLPKELSPPSP